MDECVNEMKAAITLIQGKLVALSEKQVELYHNVHIMNEETHSVIILDHVKDSQISEDISKPQFGALFGELLSKIYELKEQLEATKNEKSELSSHSQESQHLEKSKAELSDQHNSLLRMIDRITTVNDLFKKLQTMDLDDLDEKINTSIDKLDAISDDLQIMQEILHDIDTGLHIIQEKLDAVSEKLAERKMFYQVLLNYVEEFYTLGNDSSVNSEYSGTEQEYRGTLKVYIAIKNCQENKILENRSDPTSAVNRLLNDVYNDAIHDHLSKVTENTITINFLKMYVVSRMHSTDKLEDLFEELHNMHSLLSIMLDKTSALMEVLDTSKQNEEAFILHLNSKCENAKAFMTEIIRKFRDELRALKEDAAAFPSLTASLATVCKLCAKFDEILNE